MTHIKTGISKLDNIKFQTKVITKDNEEVILFHEEPITDEEIKAFKEFTKEEIFFILKFKGFLDMN